MSILCWLIVTQMPEFLWLPPVLQEVSDPFCVRSSAVFYLASGLNITRSSGPGW